MFRNPTLAALAVIVVASPAVAFGSSQAEDESAMLLAEAHDRCMAEYAVRLTHTSASDEAIYSEAEAGCQSLKTHLFAAIARDLPRPQAAELTSAFEAQAKPNFLSLLQRIRADRLARKEE